MFEPFRDLVPLIGDWRLASFHVEASGEEAILLLIEPGAWEQVIHPPPWETTPYRAKIVHVTEHTEWEVEFGGVSQPVHSARRLGQGRFLLLNGRAKPNKPNAWISDPCGKLLHEFWIGEGVEHVQVDRQDRIWVAYNDQGYAQPISERGLSCFDSQGQLLSPWWDAFDPFDTYAMNVAKDAIWLYYYTPFPVARLGYDGKVQEWHHGVRGAQAILAHGNRVALFGGYEPDRSQLSLLELMPNQTALLRHQETVLLAEGCPAGRVQGRGGHFHTLEDNVWYRLSPGL